MVIDRRRQVWAHHTFAELPEFLEDRDVLVRNTTRVVPARLIGRRVATGGKCEGLFLRELPDGAWEMLVRTRGHLKPGERLVVGQDLQLVIEGRGVDGSWLLRPQCNSRPFESVLTLLERHGQIPLPPYIRHGREDLGDRESYQTVYSLQPGSIAAPTAGLHFTNELFARLVARGISLVDLTLHIGWATFRPMEVEHLSDHVIHSEHAELSAQAVAALQARRQDGGRIVAIGTTSARVLETAATGGQLQPFAGETQLFIRPGHLFSGLDGLVTNFHLPRSSLLVLVSALAGRELICAAYAEAIRQRYRFFSYGDAMLIL
jgi:S-adenosylmethionine:tRNA ribosyltransferase-isomerase